MIDNFSVIKPMLVFDDPDLFYFIQILQRKKENPQLGSNSRVIKDYFIGSLERLNELEEEMKGLCNHFNARAMIRLNRRSYEQCHLKSIEKIVNQLMNKDHKAARTSYVSACGANHKEPNKTWIIDIDYQMVEPDRLDDFRFVLAKIRPIGDKMIGWIPSVAGGHIISKPFDVSEFTKTPTHQHIDIHKDNPTNLFIP